MGIGDDYPVSATIMSKYAGKARRGMLVTLVFTTQAAGLIFGPLLAAALLLSGMNHSWVWRLHLIFGARFTTTAVVSMRRRDIFSPGRLHELAVLQRPCSAPGSPDRSKEYLRDRLRPRCSGWFHRE